MLGRALAAGTCVTLVALAAAAPASAQAPIAPYDGSIPFNCVLQDVGTGTDFPYPDADPFCVEFDKTSQSLLPNAGLIDFLAQEPNRVAAASPKCFYYQRDHWTGALVQGQPPELWHWDGGYFFDKAKGIGGTSFANFRIGGQPADATPFVPPAYHPYLDEDGGGGGALTQLGSGPDPSCVAKVDTDEEREDVYGDTPIFPNCIPPGGELRKRKVGRIRLGLRRGRVLAKLGEPHSRRHRTDRWCLIGNARLKIAYRSGAARARSGAARAGGRHVTLIRTSSRGHSEDGIGPATKLKRAKRALELDFRFRVRGKRVFEAPTHHNRRLFAGVRRHRVRYLAMVDRARLRSLRAVKNTLRRTG